MVKTTINLETEIYKLLVTEAVEKYRTTKNTFNNNKLQTKEAQSKHTIRHS